MQWFHDQDSDAPLPFGTPDLDPAIQVEPGPTRRVRCFVRGCQHVLRTPTRGDRGESCPTHAIFCHHSASTGATYSYADARRNIIAAQDVFASRLVGHPFKYESHRLGLENSEDALTWNVFRSLQEAGRLHEVARWITGLDIDAEPLLFLWGICLTADSFQPWGLLIAARDRFEQNLPVLRPLTEPDITLFLPGRYLVLIEAKFTGPNPCYSDGPRKDAGSLTKAELLDIYCDPQLRILDVDRARKADKVRYQLWRNLVFAEWMARAENRTTKAYHASLTRAGRENESCAEFRRLIRPGFADRFTHIAWEDIYHLCEDDQRDLARLRRYMGAKTCHLQPAFRLN